MADVSARPGQAKSAPVSRFELNPQTGTRYPEMRLSVLNNGLSHERIIE